LCSPSASRGIASRIACETLDALQLAVALDLAGQNLLDRFVVADQSLATVAAAERLKVVNPETS
jgi:hypothetical protein